MLREILAQECEARGFSFASQALQNPEKYGETHWTMVALKAMRRVYLRGRDDANSDADAAENESIEQMDDDASPSNPG